MEFTDVLCDGSGFPWSLRYLCHVGKQIVYGDFCCFCSGDVPAGIFSCEERIQVRPMDVKFIYYTGDYGN